LEEKMSGDPELTKAELMEQIDSTWTALQNALDRLDEIQLTMAKDDAGWAVKDHVLHLAAWERSALYLLQSRPRHAGLGVDEALYRDGSYDEINAAIFERGAGLAVEEARARLGDVHGQMMALLDELSETDLFKSYGDYLPAEGAGGPAVINLVFGNTAHHFAEHLDWIEALASEDGGE
jgi:hypothetical protein